MQVKKQTAPLANRRSNCPINFALEMFGDKWTLLIVRDMLLFGKRTYGEFQASPENIATNILADRLQRLENAGLVKSEDDPKNKRRTIYTLTDKGMDLAPILAQMMIWSAKHDPHTVVSSKLLSKLENDPRAFVNEVRKRVGTADSPER
jgi:DNA-binding HxlR family transcriptional regulator